MRVTGGDSVIESAWLSRVLEASPDWPYGSLQVSSATRIGTDYSLSGRIHRVVAETARGGSQSFVVKQESAEAVERELLFRSECGALLRGCIPDCLGGVSDTETGRGVLLLEDVTPAEQGDVLQGCTHEQAEAVVRVLARVHGATGRESGDGFPESLPRWSPRPMEPDRWADRLTRASERFPGILTPDVTARIRELPETIADAVEQLGHGPASWIHVDAHLDNVLWRPDGTVVLLDWCNAAIGPPAVDLLRFLTEGVVGAAQPERVAALSSTYAQELRMHGLLAEPIDLEVGFALALRPLVQGVVGWAGSEDLESEGRPAALCENYLRSVCAWSVSDDYGLHGTPPASARR